MNAPAWYYQSGDDIVGPLNPVQLKQATAQGLIQSDTQVRQEEGPWQTASDINGLAQILAAGPTPPASAPPATPMATAPADVGRSHPSEPPSSASPSDEARPNQERSPQPPASSPQSQKPQSQKSQSQKSQSQKSQTPKPPATKPQPSNPAAAHPQSSQPPATKPQATGTQSKPSSSSRQRPVESRHTATLPDSYEVLETVTDSSLRIDVLGYKQLSGSRDPQTAVNLFFAHQAGLQLKQVRISLNKGSAITEAGALHYLQGAIEATSSVGGVAGLGKAFFKNLTTQESLFTPRYEGTGELYLEPSFGFYMIRQLRNEEIIADKGLFYCGSGSLDVGVVAQKNISSALMGGEGLFQVSVKGTGLCVFEIPVPVQELKRVDLNNDTLKVDGNFALMRTGSLNFTVEKSTKGILGSLASGEGLLQTFRGTGTVWLAPTQAIYSRIRMGGLTDLTSAQRSSGTTT